MRAAFLCLLIVAASASAQFRVSASVDKNPVRAGEALSLSVVCEGAVTGVSSPTLPVMRNVQITGGPFTSTNVSIVNGRSSSSLTYNYRMKAPREGDAEIGPISVTYDGKTYTTNPIRLKVLAAGATTPGRTGTGQGGQSDDVSSNVFIRVIPDRSEVVQGEQVTVSYKIFFNVQMTSPEITQLPRAPGFWVEEIPMPNNLTLTDEIINGKAYKGAVVRKFAMFPTSTGELEIEPMELQTQIERQKSKSRDPFDIFNDPFFRLGSPREQVQIASPRLKIKVKPLPDSAPPGFSGAVGNFKLSAAFDRPSAKANEAVTLSVKIEGTGNIKTLPEPVISFPQDFDRYDPKQSEQISRSQGRISGVKLFEYVMIPRAPGVQRIPEISLSFFDPAGGKYETVTSPALTLNVERGDGVPGAGSGAQVQRRDVASVGTDIAFVKTHPGVFHTVGSAPHREVTFWIFAVGPWAALAATVMISRRRSSAAARTPARIRAAKLAAIELGLATKAAAKKANLDACRHIASAMNQLLSVASGSGQLTDQHSIREQWHGAGYDEQQLESILSLQRELDMSRFAVGTVEDRAVADFLARAKKIVIEYSGMQQNPAGAI